MKTREKKREKKVGKGGSFDKMYFATWPNLKMVTCLFIYLLLLFLVLKAAKYALYVYLSIFLPNPIFSFGRRCCALVGFLGGGVTLKS